jgi:hypothetical protein
MKKKKVLSKLVLNKETIRLLQNPKDLREVAGGVSYVQTRSGCMPCFCP